ncbi:MAG TPA: hypothetical protein VLM75_15910 [Spirochaetota bacterium]|nr:hypothetical protein [Spirochaetota bacterium]
MNTKNPLLKEAYRLASSGRHDDAVLILERITAASHSDPYALFLLAVEYLQSGAIGRIEPVLRKLRSIDQQYPPLVRLELFLFLKSAENTVSALARYIDALQRFPGDRHIARAIASIRRAGDFATFQRKARLLDFVPLEHPTKNNRRALGAFNGMSRHRISTRMLVVAAFSIALLVIFSTAFLYRDGLIGLFDFKTVGNFTGSTPVDMVTIDGSRHDLIDKIRRERARVFYYSNEEVVADFNNARALLKKNRHNEALIMINKILNSNAAFSVKERAEFLSKYTLTVEDRAYDAIAFEDVAGRPYLYRGFAVEWTGRAANVSRKDGRLLFNLMTGHDGANTFSGIADIYCEKDVPGVSNGNMVMVRALFVNNPGGDTRPYLVAREVRVLQAARMGK